MEIAIQQTPPLQPVPPASTQRLAVGSNLELAKLLAWKSPKMLTLLGKNKQSHYSTLYLRKRGASGRLRILHNPDGLMRAAQFRILTRILEKVEIPDYVYAFEKGKNIPKMAEAHTGKGLVISMDLKDFFTSIKQRHLLEIFTELGFAKAPATTLSELCTYKSFVPQGALTSPKISNIVTAKTFGPELKVYCDEKGYTLTVYADDITISSREDLVKQSGYDAAFEIVGFVSTLVAKYGFKVNRQKTKVMRPFQRQYVCGAVVNRKVNLQKSERNKLRAIVHNTVTQGIEASASRAGVSPEQFVSRTMGRLNWFGQLNPEVGVRLKSKFKEVVQEHGTPNAGSEDGRDPAPSVTSEVETV